MPIDSTLWHGVVRQRHWGILSRRRGQDGAVTMVRRPGRAGMTRDGIG